MNNFRRLFALNRKLPWQYVYQSQMFKTRHLFTPSSLGLDSFVNVVDHIKGCFPNKEDFKSKMKNFSDPSSNSLVLLEDVKKMIALTETDEDLNILHGLLVKYFKEQESITFRTFRISPLVMRALHILNKPEKAVQMVEDPICYPHFSIYSTVLIFLDLLLTNHMYNEVVKYYNIFEGSFSSVPSNLSLILLAACYKLNTEDSYKKARTVYRLESEFRTSYRKTVFIAALAINQNDPFCALEVLNYVKRLESIPASLKIMALAKGGRYSDVLELAGNLLEQKTEKRFYIPADVLTALENEFQNAPEKFKSNFNKVLNKLQSCLVSERLEDFLFAQVQVSRPNKEAQKEFPERAESKRY